MPLLSRQLTPLDCHNWRKKKNKNPISGYKIDTKGLIYKEIESQCKTIKSPDIIDNKEEKKTFTKKPLLTRNLTLDDCKYWLKNKHKNPISKYTLKEDSAIYKEIKNQCDAILSSNASLIENKVPPKSESIIEDEPLPDIITPKPTSKSHESTSTSDSESDSESDSDSDHESTSKSDIDIIQDNKYYPDISDNDFKNKLAKIYEFNMHTIPPYDKIKSLDDFQKNSDKLCGTFEKTFYQYLMSKYISVRTPYKSLLMYHAVGVGKTCSSITLAETFLIPHSTYDEPKIWVIMPLSLKGSFKEQIFNVSKMQDFATIANQCTGETYINLAQIIKDSNPDKINNKIKKLIKSRYRIFTYDSFASFIEKEYIEKNIQVKDKVIIIDEAHNIRSSNADDKRIYNAITNILPTGLNNRLVLLSATPMYNEPDDIFDLLYLLLLNDKRFNILKPPFPKIFNDKNEINPSVMELLKKLSSNYISYLRGKNPFSFAVKLSPSDSGIKILDKELPKDINNNPIPATDSKWLSRINDGIIPSQLGNNQLEYIENKFKNLDDNNIFNNLQPMNIVYDTDVGEKGFYTFFTRKNNNEPINVKYNKKYDLALYPDEDNLGKYSGKFLKLCNILKQSKGVVVIYSRFIWSGVIPLSICLEHMGYSRELGTSSINNFLDDPKIIDSPPKYDNIKYPKYCILSSENREVMGNTNIDSLLKLINSPKNIDGSVIKVILMTPVAGEGLSFYNIREMHLVEPWYHFNRVDQIIGRGIRNCSHQRLPISDKNVTVFMHAGIDGIEKETPDIHAFRIATKKLNQSHMIDDIIRNNAFDCIFMKNINYFPKNIFELGVVKMNTSQNKTIDYIFGDDEKIEPKCDIKKYKTDTRGFRKETYEHLIPNVQIKLRNIILESIHNGNRFITIDEILDKIIFDKNIILEGIKKSLYPYILIDGYTLIPHENGLHIIDITENIPMKIRISMEKKEAAPKEADIKELPKCILKKLLKLDKDNEQSAAIALYSSIDSSCFNILVKKFIESPSLDATEEFIAKCLYNQGTLISNKEFKHIKSTTAKYLGYVDIFNTAKFDPILFINQKYRDCTEKELIDLISVRKKLDIPNMSKESIAWGMFVPTIIKKGETTYNNIFKILAAGSSVGKRTGINCNSLQKKEHSDILEKLSVTDKYDTKVDNCNAIALELLKINRLTLYPEYKPTIPA